MHVRVRSLVAFLITGVDTDGFSIEAQLPFTLGTPTVEHLDDVLGPLLEYYSRTADGCTQHRSPSAAREHPRYPLEGHDINSYSRRESAAEIGSEAK